MNNALRDREKVKREMEQLQEINTDYGHKVIEDLNEDLKACTSEVVKQLTKHLSSDEVKRDFVSWKPEELEQTGGGSWEDTKLQIRGLLSRRFQEVIDKWEEENKVFANAHQSLIQQLHQRLRNATAKLDELQRDVTGVPEQDIHRTSPWEWMLTGVFRAALYAGAAATGPTFPKMLAITLCDQIIGRKMPAMKNWKYSRDKIASLKNFSTTYLNAVTQEEVLTNFVKDKFSGFKSFLDKIDLPGLIEENAKLYQKLETDERSHDALRQVYQPIKDKGSTLRRQLAVFGIRNVCAVDIKSRELLWNEDESSRLGSGAFEAVYQGQMTRHKEVKTVTLKVCKEQRVASNAIAIMEEVKFLR